MLQQQVKTLKDEQPEELEAVLRPQDVADSIHYLAHVGDARPTTSFCWRQSGHGSQEATAIFASKVSA